MIDIVTSIFITFGRFTIDRWMSGIDNTLDEGNLNVVLAHHHAVDELMQLVTVNTEGS